MGLISLLLAVFLIAVGSFFVLNETGSSVESDYADRVNTKQTVEDRTAEAVPDYITNISSEKSVKTSGHKIDLRGQNLSKVPNNIFSQTDTVALDLSNNNLGGALPAEIRQLKNLTQLDLSNNNFTGVPAEIGQLSRLEVLNLSNNPITGLPYELKNLKQLKVLDLRGTNYSKQDLEVIREGLTAEIKID